MRTRFDGRLKGGLGIALLVTLGVALSGCAANRYQSPPPLDEAARAVMEGTTQQVLEENADGQGANWSISETGHAGTVIPTRSYETPSGQTCRGFQQTVSVGGITRAAYGTACRKTEGGWQRVDYTGLADIRLYRRPYRYQHPQIGHVPGYGYRPYYPEAGFGVFFGHGHRYSNHRHRRHHHRKHEGHRGQRQKSKDR